MTSIANPPQLVGLMQAAYVMGCLARQNDEKEIVRSLGGDMQLLAMWKSFLIHNGWITKDSEGWSVTPKGAMWRNRVTVV